MVIYELKERKYPNGTTDRVPMPKDEKAKELEQSIIHAVSLVFAAHKLTYEEIMPICLNTMMALEKQGKALEVFPYEIKECKSKNWDEKDFKVKNGFGREVELKK